MRQLQINVAICSNDVISCYDRIIYSVASIAYQILGILVRCMLESIQNMKRNICTGYGDLIWFKSSKGILIPFQGILYGNSTVCTKWIVLSTPLLNILHTAGHGDFFQSPITKRCSLYVAKAYVDNTDLLEYKLMIPISQLMK